MIDDKLTPGQKATMDAAREFIAQKLENIGGFTHNIVGSKLRAVAKEISYEAANELIDEFDLDDLLGIAKLNKTGSMKEPL
jgi:hypothetical protein